MSRNVPKLRFKGFEDEWKKEVLGDLIVEKIEKTEDKGKYPLYSLTIESGVVPKSDRYEREFLVKKEGNFKIVNNNDFVYNPMNLRFGALAIYKGDFPVSVSGYYNVFSFKNRGLEKFWDNYLKTDRMMYLYNTIATGSLEEKKRVHYSQFKELKLPMPSLQEQEKIANFLSKVDSIIEKQEKKVQYWNSYKKGMMQKIFSQKIRFKDENGMDYPEWKINKIENIATIEMGFTPSTKNDEAWNGNIEWLSIAGMNSKYIYSGNKKISSEILGKRKLVPIDTLIMSFKLTIGRLAIVKKEIVTNEAICQFYWKSKDISNEYMYAYLSVINIESFGCRAAKGITLNTESLNSIVVKLPCLEEQTKIANFLSNIDNIIEKESKKLEELKQWKKGLLQQMFV